MLARGPPDTREMAEDLELLVPGGKTLLVPPVPEDPSDFAAAIERAFVALPQPCTTALGLQPNYCDKDGRLELWFGRATELILDDLSS